MGAEKEEEMEREPGERDYSEQPRREPPTRRDEFIEARTRAEIIVQRALNDPQLRERLKEDPGGTIQRFGISQENAEDLAREIQIDGQTLWPDDCTWTCSWTCFWSDWF
jgi:hypothetical protein